MGEAVFNPEVGLANMANDEETYIEVLKMYAARGDEKKARLCELYQNKNWKDYIIDAHALKSTSLSIGAEKLSALAKELELSGKAENYAVIEEKHAYVMEQYDVVIKCVQAYLNGQNPVAGGKETIKKDCIVLVVDEDKDNLVCAKKTLADMCKVVCALSDRHALDYLDNNTPDIALIDIGMTEVFEKIRGQEATKEIPVLLLAAETDGNTEERCAGMGTLGVIKKPFDAEELKTKILNLLA